MARKVVSSLREDWLKNFARYLRSKRKKSRLSQKDLAQSVSSDASGFGVIPGNWYLALLLASDLRGISHFWKIVDLLAQS